MAGEGSAAGWKGSVAIGPGSLEFTGAIGPAAAHAHAAVQVLVVTAGEVALRDSSGDRRAVTSAVVPTGVRHELLAAPGARGTITYLDPVSPPGRLAARRVAETGLDVHRVDAWLVRVDTTVRAGRADPAAVHPAVTETLRLAAATPGEAMPLREMAARVALSPSRLGHLFTEQVGVPYSVWRRWLRLQRALAAVRSGASLTTAAHAAGFADSAHLTRSCRAMFGVTPTEGVRASGARRAGAAPVSLLPGPGQVSGSVQAPPRPRAGRWAT